MSHEKRRDQTLLDSRRHVPKWINHPVMLRKSVKLNSILNKVPGKQQFGVFRFLPFLFLIGAGLEFTMIKLHVGPVNFCMLTLFSPLILFFHHEFDCMIS